MSVAIDALVAIESDKSAFDCRIVDSNQFGARVHVGAARLPDSFYLIDILSALAYRAEVRWRNGDYAGLQFHETHRLYQRDAPLWLCELRQARLQSDARERTPYLTSQIPGPVV